jgi:acetyl esterase/lipase
VITTGEVFCTVVSEFQISNRFVRFYALRSDSCSGPACLRLDALSSGEDKPSPSAAQDDPSLGKAFVYKQVEGRELSLWIVEPQDVGSTDASPVRAAVVLFPRRRIGRGRRAQMLPQARVIAQHGGVGVTVQYRFILDHTQEPRICIEDTKSAVRWLREHAKTLRIDSDRNAIGGASAGGYSAAYATMAPGWDAPGDDMPFHRRGTRWFSGIR